MSKQESYETLKNSKTLKILFYVLFLFVIGGLFLIFRYYFWPFLFAIIFYMALSPINERISGLTGNRFFSSTIVIFFLFILIIVPMFFLMASLADQIYQMYIYVQNRIGEGLISEIQKSSILQNVVDYFNIRPEELIRKGTELVQKAAGTAFSRVTSIISLPFNFIMNFFFMILILFFLLKDGYMLEGVIYKVLPFPDDIEEEVVQRLKQVVKILIAGNVSIMFCQGFMVGLGLFFCGFNMFILWGSIAAILSLIPVIGTAIVWAPAVLYLIVAKSYLCALFLGIWSLLWYLLLENLVKPKLFGNRLNFHPAVLFFLLLGSIQAFNLPGVIIGPLLLTLYYSLYEIYKFFDEYDMGKKLETLD